MNNIWRKYISSPLLLTTLLLFLLSSCEKKSELSISEEKMVEVLTDMFLAEAAMQRLTKQVKDTLSLTYYEQIYQVHDLNREEYLLNLKAMEKNPKLAKKIYDKVLEKVSEEENKY